MLINSWCDLPPPFVVLTSGSESVLALSEKLLRSCFSLHATNDFALLLTVTPSLWWKGQCIFTLHSDKNTFQHVNCIYRTASTIVNLWVFRCCVVPVKSCSFIPSDSCHFSEWERFFLCASSGPSMLQVWNQCSIAGLWDWVTCYMRGHLELGRRKRKKELGSDRGEQSVVKRRKRALHSSSTRLHYPKASSIQFTTPSVHTFIYSPGSILIHIIDIHKSWKFCKNAFLCLLKQIRHTQHH